MWKFSTGFLKQPGASLGPHTIHPKMVRWALGSLYSPYRNPSLDKPEQTSTAMSTSSLVFLLKFGQLEPVQVLPVASLNSPLFVNSYVSYHFRQEHRFGRIDTAYCLEGILCTSAVRYGLPLGRWHPCGSFSSAGPVVARLVPSQKTIPNLSPTTRAPSQTRPFANTLWFWPSSSILSERPQHGKSEWSRRLAAPWS